MNVIHETKLKILKKSTSILNPTKYKKKNILQPNDIHMEVLFSIQKLINMLTVHHIV